MDLPTRFVKNGNTWDVIDHLPCGDTIILLCENQHGQRECFDSKQI